MGTEMSALEQAREAAGRIAREAERLHDEHERMDADRVTPRLAELSVAMDEMRAAFVQQVEELVPAPAIEEMYARLGTSPASGEVLEE